MKANLEPEPFVDAVEAAEFLRLRSRRVLELARQGAIPAYPLGQGKRKVWRFRLSEIADAVRARSVDYPRQSPAPRQETI
jgi:Helix-turn-helix domain